MYLDRQRYTVFWPYTICRPNTKTKRLAEHPHTHTQTVSFFFLHVAIRNSLRSKYIPGMYLLTYILFTDQALEARSDPSSSAARTTYEVQLRCILSLRLFRRLVEKILKTNHEGMESSCSSGHRRQHETTTRGTNTAKTRWRTSMPGMTHVRAEKKIKSIPYPRQARHTNAVQPLLCRRRQPTNQSTDSTTAPQRTAPHRTTQTSPLRRVFW